MRGVAVLLAARADQHRIGAMVAEGVTIDAAAGKILAAQDHGFVEAAQVPLVDAHLAPGGMDRPNPPVGKIIVDVLAGDRAMERVEALPRVALPFGVRLDENFEVKLPAAIGVEQCVPGSGPNRDRAGPARDLDRPALLATGCGPDSATRSPARRNSKGQCSGESRRRPNRGGSGPCGPQPSPGPPHRPDRRHQSKGRRPHTRPHAATNNTNRCRPYLLISAPVPAHKRCRGSSCPSTLSPTH